MRDGRAENRNISRCAYASLKCRCRVRHNQINIRRDKAIRDGRTGRNVIRCVLFVKNHVVAELVGQRVAETLRCSIQRFMLNELQNTNMVNLVFRGSSHHARQRQTQRHHQSKHLFHTGKPPSVLHATERFFRSAVLQVKVYLIYAGMSSTATEKDKKKTLTVYEIRKEQQEADRKDDR